MIWHPLVLAMILLDSISLVLLSSSLFTSLNIVVHWNESLSDRFQIALERKSHHFSLVITITFYTFIFTSLLWLIGLTTLFPPLIPGAMCGTGVLQAMGPSGYRVLTFRLLFLFLVMIWSSLDHINKQHPLGPLVHLTNRIFLLAAPFFYLAFIDTCRSVHSLAAAPPVNCCAVLYEVVEGKASPFFFSFLTDRFVLWMFLFSSIVLMGGGIILIVKHGLIHHRLLLLHAAFSMWWVGWAVLATVRIFTVYHYEVLSHSCPWCLFLPEHGAIGFPLLIALFFVVTGSTRAYISSWVITSHPELKSTGLKWWKRNLMLSCLFQILFLLVILWPAISWRIKYGMWLHSF